MEMERRIGNTPICLTKGQTLSQWFRALRGVDLNDNRSPGASYLRCDWCGQEHRRWFVQKVCTNCVTAPRGYHRRLYELTAWGVACAACGLIGFLAAWVTK